MLAKKNLCEPKLLVVGSHKNTDYRWRTLPINRPSILILCLASLLCSGCVTGKELVKREAGLTDTQEKLKDRNEEINETKLRMAYLEESWKRLNKKLLTLQMEYNALQEKYSELSEKLEELELDFVDVDLKIFNRLTDLEAKMTDKDMDISQTVKELTDQLKTFKRRPDGSGASAVIHLRGQVEKIENRIEEIQSKLSGNIKERKKNTQETPYESIIDVINKFDKYYGGPQMDKITDLTTARFRENRPGAVWVAKIWKVLDNLKYKRLSSVIIESKIEQNNALVVLESEIQTKAGETLQKEIFYLIKEKGRWLINELVVADDKTDVSQMGFKE